jgi:DNA helicase-2/ATP-dependent DNA helicase PcrA
VIEHILRGGGAWEAGRWAAFCEALRTSLRLKVTTRAATYCQFNQQGADAEQDGGSNLIVLHYDVAVQLGSVHSVKGRTADAVLLVETESWRGPAANQRVMDLATVLPHAFGIEDRNFSSNEAELAAATNVFVAVTRPRSMLALAIRRDALPQAVREAAQAQGWIVRDLHAPAV